MCPGAGRWIPSTWVNRALNPHQLWDHSSLHGAGDSYDSKRGDPGRPYPSLHLEVLVHQTLCQARQGAGAVLKGLLSCKTWSSPSRRRLLGNMALNLEEPQFKQNDYRAGNMLLLWTRFLGFCCCCLLFCLFVLRAAEIHFDYWLWPKCVPSKLICWGPNFQDLKCDCMWRWGRQRGSSGKWGPYGWPPMWYDSSLYKERRLGHRHPQRKNHGKMEKVPIQEPRRETLEETSRLHKAAPVCPTTLGRTGLPRNSLSLQRPHSSLWVTGSQNDNKQHSVVLLHLAAQMMGCAAVITSYPDSHV